MHNSWSDCTVAWEDAKLYGEWVRLGTNHPDSQWQSHSSSFLRGRLSPSPLWFLRPWCKTESQSEKWGNIEHPFPELAIIDVRCFSLTHYLIINCPQGVEDYVKVGVEVYWPRCCYLYLRCVSATQAIEGLNKCVYLCSSYRPYLLLTGEESGWSVYHKVSVQLHCLCLGGAVGGVCVFKRWSVQTLTAAADCKQNEMEL